MGFSTSSSRRPQLSFYGNETLIGILREAEALEATECFFLNHVGQRRPFLPVYVVLAREERDAEGDRTFVRC
jgi:hypothetical protein